jgi:ABC-type multidrug transport system permease subunit
MTHPLHDSPFITYTEHDALSSATFIARHFSMVITRPSTNIFTDRISTLFMRTITANGIIISYSAFTPIITHNIKQARPIGEPRRRIARFHYGLKPSRHRKRFHVDSLRTESVIKSMLSHVSKTIGKIKTGQRTVY